MTLDLTKPIRHKGNGERGRIIGVLDRQFKPYVVAFRASKGKKKQCGEEYPITMAECVQRYRRRCLAKLVSFPPKRRCSPWQWANCRH